MIQFYACYCVQPESVTCSQPLLGWVVYIHPRRRFACLEFGEGENTWRECFPIEKLKGKRVFSKKQKTMIAQPTTGQAEGLLCGGCAE